MWMIGEGVAEGEEDKVEVSEEEKCEAFLVFKGKAASSVFISGNRAEIRGQVATLKALLIETSDFHC